MKRPIRTRVAAAAVSIALAASGCAAGQDDGNQQTAAEPDRQSARSGPSAGGEAPAQSTNADADPFDENRTSPYWERAELYSEALQKQMAVNVYLPPGYTEERKYPVVYLLHGFGGGADSWIPTSGIPAAADRLIQAGEIDPVILVSPQLDTSFGINASEEPAAVNAIGVAEGRYEDYVKDDLRRYIESHYAADASAEARAIGGISMGGFAALHIAFRNPELYAKAGGHSASLWFDDSTDFADQKAWAFGDAETKRQRDPLELAGHADLSGLAVYLDCGESDGFAPRSEALHERLQARGFRSELHIQPGGHNGAYWMSHLDDYLRFYAG